MSGQMNTIPPEASGRRMPSDRSHTRICLTDAGHPDPMVSLFLVPEPRVRGANMLHLLEQDPVGQDPVGQAPRPDPELISALQARGLPGAAVAVLPCASGHPDPRDLRHTFHDHYIADGPMGLDTCDTDEMARLAMLPEHSIGPRRIDDFADGSVREVMLAVYRYFGVDQRIPLMYHGFADPAERWLGVRTASA